MGKINNAYPRPCTLVEATRCVWDGGKAQLRFPRDETWHDMYIHNSFVCYDRCGENDSALLILWHYRITEPAPVKATPDKSATVSTAEAIAAVLAGALRAESASEGRRKLRLRITYNELRCVSIADGALLGGPPTNERWVIYHNTPEPIKLDIPATSINPSTLNLVYDAIEDIRECWPGKIKVTCTVEAVD